MEAPTPKKNQVWLHKATNIKVVLILDRHIEAVQSNPELYEFVCDKPHADGDFDYDCGFELCRCSQ